MNINFLGAATDWIFPGILLLMVIGLFVMNIMRNKKYQENAKNVMESLKVGDLIKTYSGIYGKIIEITETTDGKVALIQTGDKGFMSIDMNAIYCLDEKKPVVYDMDGNIITPENNQEKLAMERGSKEMLAEQETILDGKIAEKTKSNSNKSTTSKTSTAK